MSWWCVCERDCVQELTEESTGETHQVGAAKNRSRRHCVESRVIETEDVGDGCRRVAGGFMPHAPCPMRPSHEEERRGLWREGSSFFIFERWEPSRAGNQ